MRFICKKFSNKIFNNPRLNFYSLCRMYNNIEQSPSRLDKELIFTDYLSQFINSKDEEEKKENFFCMGQIVKVSIPYLNLIQQKELLGGRDKHKPLIANSRFQYTFDNLIQLYLIEKFKITKDKIQDYFIKHGDLASYLLHLYTESNLPPKEAKLYIPPLTITEVLDHKEKINLSIGTESQGEKLEIVRELFNKCTDSLEILYVARILLNKLKIGIGDRGVIGCLKQLKSKYDQDKTSEYREMISFLEKNVFKYKIDYSLKLDDESENVSLVPGEPIQLELCKLGVNMKELMSSLQRSTLSCLMETKYDGERSQMHFNGDQLMLASRNFEDQSELYKKLQVQILNEVNFYNQANPKQRLNSFIIDGEIVCFSKRRKAFYDFQELRKKQSEEEMDPDKKYFFIAFDIIYINGLDVHFLPIDKRKELLGRYFYKNFNTILVEMGRKINLNNQEAKGEMREYFKFSKSINCEGLVIKIVGENSQYEFGKRKWYKVSHKS